MAPTSVTICVKVTRTMTSNVQYNEEGDRIDERWPILHVRQKRGDFAGQERADNERLMKPAVRNNLRFVFFVVRHVNKSRNIIFYTPNKKSRMPQYDQKDACKCCLCYE